jgi:predicted phosphodiesterase
MVPIIAKEGIEAIWGKECADCCQRDLAAFNSAYPELGRQPSSKPMRRKPEPNEEFLMRLALISDIHANLPALQAVLQHIAGQSDIAATYHLGDLVGYSSSPNEVVQLLRRSGISGVAGNYDSTVATDYKHCGCKAENARQEELAHVSYEWTLRAIHRETKEYLGGLPFRIDIRPRGGHVAGSTITLVHATPNNNLIYVTEDRPNAFLTKMAQAAGLRAGDVLCFGHTHKPWQREVDGVLFVNTGSVGRPKDGDWRSSYVVLDIGAGSVRAEIIRVEYDVQEAMRGLRGANLPDDFAEFLRTGGQMVQPVDSVSASAPISETA